MDHPDKEGLYIFIKREFEMDCPKEYCDGGTFNVPRTAPIALRLSDKTMCSYCNQTGRVKRILTGWVEVVYEINHTAGYVGFRVISSEMDRDSLPAVHGLKITEGCIDSAVIAYFEKIFPEKVFKNVEECDTND